MFMIESSIIIKSYFICHNAAGPVACTSARAAFSCGVRCKLAQVHTCKENSRSEHSPAQWHEFSQRWQQEAAKHDLHSGKCTAQVSKRSEPTLVHMIVCSPLSCT